MDMLATDLAEYLVGKGVPFRETHHISGNAVRLAESLNTSLDQLTLDQLKTLHPEFENDVMQVWNYESSVENRSSIGGTCRLRVLEQIKELKEALEKR